MQTRFGTRNKQMSASNSGGERVVVDTKGEKEQYLEGKIIPSNSVVSVIAAKERTPPSVHNFPSANWKKGFRSLVYSLTFGTSFVVPLDLNRSIRLHPFRSLCWFLSLYTLSYIDRLHSFSSHLLPQPQPPPNPSALKTKMSGATLKEYTLEELKGLNTKKDLHLLIHGKGIPSSSPPRLASRLADLRSRVPAVYAIKSFLDEVSPPVQDFRHVNHSTST